MRVFRALLLGFGATMVFLTIIIGPTPLVVPFLLLFGWILSAGRLIHSLHPEPGTLFVFAAATLVLIAGTDAFLRWLFQSNDSHPSREGESTLHWRLKWTICGYGILFCALISIASLVLTTHQLFWISKSPEPWLINATKPRITLILTSGALYNAAETNQWNTARTRAVFLSMNSSSESCPLIELFHPVWIEKDEATLRAILLIPRQTTAQSTIGFVVLEAGSYYRTKELSAFQEVLKSYNTDAFRRALNKSPL